MNVRSDATPGAGAGAVGESTRSSAAQAARGAGRATRGRGRLLLAFAVVYVVWGSTYLAIRWAIDGLPPLSMAGSRHLLAGALLYGAVRARGGRRPTAADWRTAALVGVLLLAVGNGCVSVGEQYVASSTAALLVASVPLWMALLGAASGLAAWPGPLAWIGLAAGMAGVAWLAHAPGPSVVALPGHDGLGTGLVLIASLGWAVGSLYARHRRSSVPVLTMGAMQMICGGATLLVAGWATGDLRALHWSAVGGRSLAAFAYLVVFGSILAYTAYGWLLKAVTPAAAGTVAFVNPIVAVLLGWALAGEVLTLHVLGSSILIVGAVVLVMVGQRPRRPSGAVGR